MFLTLSGDTQNEKYWALQIQEEEKNVKNYKTTCNKIPNPQGQ